MSTSNITYIANTDIENSTIFISDIWVKVKSLDLYYGDRNKLKE